MNKNHYIDIEIQESLDFLEELCEREIIHYPIDFEIYRSSDHELSETLKSWFGSDRWSEDGDCFWQFGQDGSGSLFLLWYYPSLEIEPPVVFLGSEGESCIFAASVNDFIQQLASGKLFCPYGDNICSWLNPDDEEKEQLDWHKLKITVENKLGKSTVSPEEIRDKALKTHPDFSSWIETKIDY
ncbi:MAG: hypothetical protein AAGE96_21765 [Cyanobacteria bacterium P01_G01_bin.19]